MADVSKNTGVEVGQACQEWHDEHVYDLNCRRIQCDEIWSFTYAKAKHIKTVKAPPEGADDTWT